MHWRLFWVCLFVGGMQGACGNSEPDRDISAPTAWASVDQGFRRHWTKTFLWGYCASVEAYDVVENARTGKTREKVSDPYIFCADSHYGRASDAEMVFYKPQKRVVDGTPYLIADLKEADPLGYNHVSCAYVDLQRQPQQLARSMQRHSVGAWYHSTKGHRFQRFVYERDAKRVDGCYKMKSVRSF